MSMSTHTELHADSHTLFYQYDMTIIGEGEWGTKIFAEIGNGDEFMGTGGT